MDQVLRQHLLRAKTRMKKQADQHRSERNFAIGDLVYLKLQPYVQTSLAPRSHQKLAFRFFGPFRIVARIGSVAYRLDLPAHSSIHPVFHVSQLKKALGATHQVIADLPSDFALNLVPEQILESRLVQRGNCRVQQVLVKWNNLPPSLATWEDYEALRQEFPRATAWVKQHFKEGGMLAALLPRLQRWHLKMIRPQAIPRSGPRPTGPRRRTPSTMATNGPAEEYACARDKR
jgi:hypothetical protein